MNELTDRFWRPAAYEKADMRARIAALEAEVARLRDWEHHTDHAKELEAEVARLWKWREQGEYWQQRYLDESAAAMAAEARAKALEDALRGLLHHEIAHVGPGAHEAVMDARSALAQKE